VITHTCVGLNEAGRQRSALGGNLTILGGGTGECAVLGVGDLGGSADTGVDVKRLVGPVRVVVASLQCVGSRRSGSEQHTLCVISSPLPLLSPSRSL
jgi:hypothetical protein